MPRNAGKILLTGAFVLATAGCASRTEWTTWEEHPTHYASGDHLSFSVRNPEGPGSSLTRSDIARAREEGWWGKAVTVGQEQILDR